MVSSFKTFVFEQIRLTISEPHNTKPLFKATAKDDAEVQKHLDSAKAHATKHKKSFHVTVAHPTGEVHTHKIHP